MLCLAAWPSPLHDRRGSEGCGFLKSTTPTLSLKLMPFSKTFHHYIVARLIVSIDVHFVGVLIREFGLGLNPSERFQDGTSSVDKHAS